MIRINYVIKRMKLKGMFDRDIFLFSQYHQDAYQVLSVSTASTNQDIKQAYHRLSKLYHPDVAQGKESEEKFKSINAAYKKIMEDRAKESSIEEETRMKYNAYVRQKNNPEEYFNNQQHQEQKEQKEYRTMNREKVQTDQYTGGQRENNTKLQIFLGFGFFSLFGAYFILHRDKNTNDSSLSENYIKRMNNNRQAIEDQKKNIVKNVFKDQNSRMLKYQEPEPDAYDLLTNYTIYPDLKMYWVNFASFYEKEEDYLQNDTFIKYPMKHEQIGIRVTHALEAERVLQNIFVKVADVLQQIEVNGFYKPPGIFMRYYGYVHFKIRNKPILVENLKEAKEYISLFDLYFQYQSPLPYFHDEFTEFKIKKYGNVKKNSPDADNWISNAYINPKTLPQIFIQGNIKNVFVSRPDPSQEDEQRYQFVWGNHHQQ